MQYFSKRIEIIKRATSLTGSNRGQSDSGRGDGGDGGTDGDFVRLSTNPEEGDV